MLGMYLARPVVKTWAENFMDEDTGEEVSIERNELLFERGRLIDQDTLAKIRFSMAADGVKEVEVSNQQRMGVEYGRTCLYPYEAKVRIDKKNVKFLLFAKGMRQAMEILSDFVELNYKGHFAMTMVKEFAPYVILQDSLEVLEKDETTDDDADVENETKPKGKKFYQIEARICHGYVDEEDADTCQTFQTFVVETFNADRALEIIGQWLDERDEERVREAIEKGQEVKRQKFSVGIETASVLSVGRLVPQEFSMAYFDD